MKNSFLILSFFVFGLINSSNHDIRNAIKKTLACQMGVEKCNNRVSNWFGPEDLVEKLYRPGTTEGQKPGLKAFHTYPLAVTSSSLLPKFFHTYRVKRDDGRTDNVISTPGILIYKNQLTGVLSYSAVAFEIAVSDNGEVGHRVATTKPEDAQAEKMLNNVYKDKVKLANFLSDIAGNNTNPNAKYADGSYIAKISQNKDMAVIERGSTKVLLFLKQR